MARTTLTVSLLPPPLLLWLLLFLGLGGVSCFNCYGANITITGQWSQPVIQNINPTDSSTFSTTVYVSPEHDFKGFSLRIRNDDQQDTSWFDFDDSCIRNEFIKHDNYWHEIKATVQRINIQKKILVFEVHTGTCIMLCKRDLRFEDIWSLDVVAYGPSKWRLTPPPAHCNVHKTKDPRQSTMDECTDPPSLPTAPTPTPRTTTTTTTPTTSTTTTTTSPRVTPSTPTTTTTTSPRVTPSTTTTTTPTTPTSSSSTSTAKSSDDDDSSHGPSLSTEWIVGVSVVVVVVVLVVVVVMILCLRKRKSAASHEVLYSPQPAKPAGDSNMDVRVNRLYESSHQNRNAAAATKHDIFVTENDLYESADQYRKTDNATPEGTVVIENDLYESADQYRKTDNAAPEGTVVIENDLYESADQYRT
ncbi:mucin-3A-like isoform X2 [Eriocheir sinensis]|uniref:mucin-3A-like isoform X2 n=1 Tax=Eriocheir sinensis TaxID=95602 RepID=UPI0021CA15D3|nr:mucin-3A-like isoform X2 [Eriocheir sinensis]